MAKNVKDVLALIKEKGIKMVDFKMVDIHGQYRHVTIPAENFSEEVMQNGIGFEPSLEYMCDKTRIEWKIAQVDEEIAMLQGLLS